MLARHALRNAALRDVRAASSGDAAGPSPKGTPAANHRTGSVVRTAGRQRSPGGLATGEYIASVAGLVPLAVFRWVRRHVAATVLLVAALNFLPAYAAGAVFYGGAALVALGWQLDRREARTLRRTVRSRLGLPDADADPLGSDIGVDGIAVSDDDPDPRPRVARSAVYGVGPTRARPARALRGGAHRG